ncbi:MAG: DNA-deoxyinosine glycosylase [Clostridia bacterium]|nr:DNA-deoxyinosine glycosylase [Clostridia bacterium]
MKHEIAPVYDGKSKILILGSFPSEASRKQGFFYGHPNNRFWRVLSAVLEEPVPQTVAEKREMLLKNGVALWDVIGSCEVDGSADSSIKDASPNDLSPILSGSGVRAVYLNGRLAFSLYEKHAAPDLPYFYLPSTSPANAAYSLDRLVAGWSVIRCML